jgi:hypothetical protein
VATSAPAAPSAPSAAPAAPAPGPGTHAAPAPSPSTAPAIPALPGVVPDDGPTFGLPADASPSSGERALAGPARGPDGRFLPSAPPADGATLTVPVGDTPVEPGTPEPAATAPFEFAGEKFESKEKAEQQVKTLKGMYRPLQALARSVGGINKIPAALSGAAESARAWKAEAERLVAEHARGAQPASAAPGATPPTPTEAPGDSGETAIDWNLYAEITKLANESGEPWKASQWLAEQQERVIQARVNKMLSDKLAPIDAERERAELSHQTETLFGNLAEYTHSDGSPAFPELHDEAAAYEIGSMWASLGLPREAAYTPQGALAAIALYRMKATRRSNPAAPAGGAPPVARPSAPPAAPKVPADVLAAASLGDGQPTVASIGGQGGPSAEAARILAGLRSVNANSASRVTLGFDA